MSAADAVRFPSTVGQHETAGASRIALAESFEAVATADPFVGAAALPFHQFHYFPSPASVSHCSS